MSMLHKKLKCVLNKCECVCVGAAIVWPKIGSNDAPREQSGYWLGSIKRENCRMSE
jgi:hypothetical protein